MASGATNGAERLRDCFVSLQGEFQQLAEDVGR